jgi:hypothetical protein
MGWFNHFWMSLLFLSIISFYYHIGKIARTNLWNKHDESQILHSFQMFILRRVITEVNVKNTFLEE